MEFCNQSRVAVTLSDDFTGEESTKEMGDTTHTFSSQEAADNHTERVIGRWISERANIQGNTSYTLVRWEGMLDR